MFHKHNYENWIIFVPLLIFRAIINPFINCLKSAICTRHKPIDPSIISNVMVGDKVVYHNSCSVVELTHFYSQHNI